jgi:hypothetical protein
MLSSPCPICNHPCSVAASTCPECGHSLQTKARSVSDTKADASGSKSRLIPCPDCGHSCSTAATSCPNCGRPFQPSQSNKSSVSDWGGTSTPFEGTKKKSTAKVFAFILALGLVGGAVFLYFWYRAPREGVLTGEVFIVSKGAQNFKLGLVEVSAIPEDKMKSFIDKKEAAIRTAINKFKAQYEAAQKELTTAQQDYDSTKAALDAALSKQSEANELAAQARADAYNSTFYSDADPQSREYQEQFVKSQKAQGQAEKANQQAAAATKQVEQLRNQFVSKSQDLGSIQARIGRIRAEVGKVVNEEFLFGGLPTGEIKAKAMTDAEGRFSMKLPSSGKFAIAARAQRYVFNSTEEYYWLIWVSLDGEQSKHITLGNNNLLGTDAKESVFRTEDLMKITTAQQL